MSATNRKQGVKSPNEFYRTPEYATASLLRSLPELADHQDGDWLEPSAGDGAIIQAVSNFGYFPLWTAIELRDECKQQLTNIEDAEFRQIVTGNPYQWFEPKRNYDVAIGNPPFTQAVEFTEQARRQSHVTIMLQRLCWIGPRERVNFFRDNPPDVRIISPRPFPDSTEYAWFIWGAGEPGTWRIITDKD